MPMGDGRPDPESVATAAEFLDALARLKRWSGAGYRQLEKRAAAAGQVLPRSTIAAALTRDTLPSEVLVRAMATACGCAPAEAEAWVAARRRATATASTPHSRAAAYLDVRHPLAAQERSATGGAAGPGQSAGGEAPGREASLRWTVAIGLVAMVAATGMYLGLRGHEPGGQARIEPSAPASQAGAGSTMPSRPAAAPTVRDAGWTRVTAAGALVLRTGEGVDLDLGRTGHEAGKGKDLALSRQGRLEIRHSARVAVLDGPGGHEVGRCADLPSGRWITFIADPGALPVGTDMCVATDQGRLAQLTVDRSSGPTTGVFRYHYTLWQR